MKSDTHPSGIYLAGIVVCLFLLPVFGLLPGATARAGAQGGLDGRAFLVERGRKGEPPFGKDLYVFEQGRFRSVSCDRFGCEGPYTSSASRDSITFVADIQSADHGAMHWEGTVRGDNIEVRYTGSDPSQGYGSSPRPAEYWGRSVPELFTDRSAPEKRLEGKAFIILTGGVGQQADHNDILFFSHGVFVSTRCEDGGFRGKTYTAFEDRDGIRFRGEVEHPEKGTMIWEGTVHGDRMEGKMRWTYEKWYWTIDREYWYRGRLVE